MIEEIKKSIAFHFGKEMMMQPGPESDSEMHFSDAHMYMIFVFSADYVRILMRSKRHSFSKNFDYGTLLGYIEDSNISTDKAAIRFIRESVRSSSGKESESMLEDWYEWKRPEIRESKIRDLGL